MTPDQSKSLYAGLRVRITSLRDNKAWFFNVDDTACLLELDTSDSNGDWKAKFDKNGAVMFIEPRFVDFEVI